MNHVTKHLHNVLLTVLLLGTIHFLVMSIVLVVSGNVWRNKKEKGIEFLSPFAKKGENNEKKVNN